MKTNDVQFEQLVDIFRALGDPARLRLLGLIAESPRTGKELAEAVSIGPPTVSHHMDRLVRSGMVSVQRTGQSRIYRLNTDTLSALSGLASPSAPDTVRAGAESQSNQQERERSKIVRDFFDGERLKQIPAQRKKRVIVLQHILMRFSPDQEYTEREVSDSLKLVHEDFATLRRELVDYGFMTRTGGVYHVARGLPGRTIQVRQEITGNEDEWFRRFLASTIER